MNHSELSFLVSEEKVESFTPLHNLKLLITSLESWKCLSYQVIKYVVTFVLLHSERLRFQYTNQAHSSWIVQIVK